MWFDEAGEIVEMFKNAFPLSFLFFVPILIIISPVSPVGAAHDFAVYRMQQYDLQGSSYGEFTTVAGVRTNFVRPALCKRTCSQVLQLFSV